jgi:hypothetical protein
MGLSKNFADAVRRELNAYAAWMPVANNFQLGDYGLFDNGVFTYVGNIFSRYPDIEKKTRKGTSTDMNFTSSDVKEVKLDAGGNIVESFAALGDAEATLKFVFTSDDSVVIKAKVSIEQLEDIDQISRKLSAKGDWKNKYKVIHSIHYGENCTVVYSSKGSNEFSVSARANVLKAIEGGSASGGFATKSTSSNILDFIGESGVLAFNLFKLNWNNNLNLLNEVDTSDLQIEDNVGIDTGDVFPDDL